MNTPNKAPRTATFTSPNKASAASGALLSSQGGGGSLRTPNKAASGSASAGPAAAGGAGASNVVPSAFRALAVPYLMGRLVDAKHADAASIRLRPALQKIQDSLYTDLENVVTAGASVSLLLLGAPGVGKTLVLERALAALAAAHPGASDNPDVGVVRLTGALHCEERTAFLEIARQLCSCFKCTFSKTATYDENLGFLKDMLLELRRALKSVVFVIDEVSAYCRRTKQMVLYNLMDALTHAGVQAAVIGVTCQYDVEELMEKRVRSRFSNRKVVVPSLPDAAPATAAQDTAAGVLQELLLLPATFEPSYRAKQYNAAVAKAMQDKALRAALEVRMRIGVSPKDLASIAATAMGKWQLASIGTRDWELSAGHVVSALQSINDTFDSRVNTIIGLSEVELAVLVAGMRLEDASKSSFNFEMAYDEYMKVKQDRHAHLWRKPVVWRAWQDLVGLGLLQYTSNSAEGRGLMQQFLPAQLLVDKSELQRGMNKHPSCRDMLKRWMRGESAQLRGALTPF